MTIDRKTVNVVTSLEVCVKLLYAVAFLVIIFIFLFLYKHQIGAENFSYRMNPLDLSVGGKSLTFLMILIGWKLLPLKVSPVNIFIFIYILFVYLPFSILWETVFGFEQITAVKMACILLFPLIGGLINKCRWLDIEEPILKFLKCKPSVNIDILFLMVLCLAFIIGYLSISSIALFDFEHSYERRMVARELMPAGSWKAYLLSISMNGVSAFVSFLGAYNRKNVYIIISIAFALFSFALIGVKAPVQYVVLMALLGFLVRNREQYILCYFLCFLMLIFIASIIEYSISSYSVIADLFVRRAFAVPAQIQSYFYDYIFNLSTENIFFDSKFIGKPITYVVGDIYFSFWPGTNANTNAFLYALGQYGWRGYFIATLFVNLFFLFLEKLYQYSNIGGEVLCVSFLYALLLVEQAYSTAFVSSGIAFVFLLCVCKSDVKAKLFRNSYD